MFNVTCWLLLLLKLKLSIECWVSGKRLGGNNDIVAMIPQGQM